MEKEILRKIMRETSNFEIRKTREEVKQNLQDSLNIFTRDAITTELEEWKKPFENEVIEEMKE